MDAKTLAEKAHKEGRQAFAWGIHSSKNPYNAHAEYNTDEYLKFHNWQNGWNYAMIRKDKE
jgi:hypothetical protein